MVKQTLTFDSGLADLRLAFKADVVNLEMQKPLLIGSVVIQNASGTHVDSKKNSIIAVLIYRLLQKN